MKRLSLLYLFFFPFLLAAQHCPFDFAYILVLDVHAAGDTSLIPGLRITALDSSGRPILASPYDVSFSGMDSLRFWQNPKKTSHHRIDNENPMNAWRIRFDFAGNNYVFCAYGNPPFRKKEDLPIRKVLIEDVDGEKNGGRFISSIVDLDVRDFYHLCQSASNWEQDETGAYLNGFEAREVVLYPSLSQENATPTELLFSWEIEQKLAEGELLPSSAAYQYTFIGDFEGAAFSYDIPISWGVDSLELENVQTGNALEKILQVARNHRIVIISESHLKPQHRIFSEKLICELADQGFDHLGLETLTPQMEDEYQQLDSRLNQRGFPLNSLRTGFFTREPRMASLVRNAIKSGYKLFAYERQEKVPGKDRDEIQCDNVLRYVEKSGVKKLIIHCGWHHVNESDELKRGRAHWLAKYIKDKTGEDPLTIYQDNFTEKMMENGHPFLQDQYLKVPAVFMDPNGDIHSLTDQVDVEVIHPRINYRNGRPSCLYQDDRYQTYFPDRVPEKIGFPLFLKAFIPGEQSEGVPVDIVEWKHPHMKKPLVLPPGDYVIQLDDKQLQIDYTISLK
jgi:hypothetical protein